MIASAREETLVDAINRLRRQGFTLDFYATADGQLGCRGCARSVDPSEVQLEHRVRFKGNSNPADEAVLLALVCTCGAMGLYSAAYGPATPPEDSPFLTRFAQREIDSLPDTTFDRRANHRNQPRQHRRRRHARMHRSKSNARHRAVRQRDSNDPVGAECSGSRLRAHPMNTLIGSRKEAPHGWSRNYH